jgi:hypothetical protein
MTALTSAPLWSISARKAMHEDLPDLAQTLAEAFFTDPLFQWWIPDADRRRQILPDFFRVITDATLPADELYTADDAVGAAVWLPPTGQLDEADMAAMAPKLERATE